MPERYNEANRVELVSVDEMNSAEVHAGVEVVNAVRQRDVREHAGTEFVVPSKGLDLVLPIQPKIHVRTGRHIPVGFVGAPSRPTLKTH